jgi:hypothetical protein
MNGDSVFDFRDFVIAFHLGGCKKGPSAVASLLESVDWILLYRWTAPLRRHRNGALGIAFRGLSVSKSELSTGFDRRAQHGLRQRTDRILFVQPVSDKEVVESSCDFLKSSVRFLARLGSR